MAGAELADSVHPAEVVRSYLDQVVILHLVIVHVVVRILLILPANVVHIQLFVDLRDDQIKDRDDVGWIVLDLLVKVLIKLEDVIAVNVQHVSIEFAHFFKLLDVVRCPLILLIIIIVIVVLDLLKVVDKVLEFHLHITSVDVCTPEDLRVRAHFIGARHLALIEHARRRGLIIGKLYLLSTVRVECWLMHEAIDVEEASLLLKIGHQGWGVQHPITEKKRRKS